MKNVNKKKVLFIMHMPPPVHGAAMMGQYIHDSKVINEAFDCHYINPSASKELVNVGKINLRKIGFLFSNLYTIVKTVRREKPDLCYFTSTIGGWGIYRDMLTVGLLKLMKKKIILHIHNKGAKNFSRRCYTNFAYKILFSNVKVILLAKELYEDVEKFVKYENVYFCPNGIPETGRMPIFRNQSHAPYTFLFLSNMIESKGVFILLEACALLKKEGLQFQCNFVGKWSDITQEIFQAKVDELALSDLVMAHGAKYGNEKDKFFQEADVLAFPTYYHNECFPLVLLEAMAYALPCISTTEGGIPSVIVEDQTGFLVPPKNIEELARKMAWMINHPEAGLEMGRKGQKHFSKNFTLAVFENRMKSILEQNLLQ